MEVAVSRRVRGGSDHPARQDNDRHVGDKSGTASACTVVQGKSSRPDVVRAGALEDSSILSRGRIPPEGKRVGFNALEIPYVSGDRPAAKLEAGWKKGDTVER